MSDPILFVSRNRVKEGCLEDFIRHYQESLPATQAGKPGTLAQLAYVSQDGTEVLIYRLFQDADGLDGQLQGADSRSKAAYQFIEPAGVEIYGTPNLYAMEMIDKVAGSGIDVSLHPQYIGGFIRP